jgi:hypothetical protein
MAKKQQESGPGTFMILVLVFFILATLILGVTTYMGFNGQTELETQAKTSDEKAKAAAKNADEMTLRLNVLRVITGTETPDDRKALAGAPAEQVPNILAEVKNVNDKVGAAGVLPGSRTSPFNVATSGAEGAAPAITPSKTLPQIAKEWERIAKDAQGRYETAEAARKKAVDQAQQAQAQRDADKKAFDTSVGNLNEQMAAKIKAMDVAFQDLKKQADQKGLDFKKFEESWAEEKTKLEEQITVHKNDINVLKQRLDRALSMDPSDIDARWKNFNFGKIAERMGTVQEKSGTFVTLNFTTKIVLIPGQSFVVIPPGRSLAEVIDRERALDKRHHEFLSAAAREPFTDNEMIKGMVEITDVTGPYSARARVTYQNNEIRDPISRGDSVFNMSLSSGEKEHVALAGIVDLDGDGKPDTEQFIRLLEKNNVIVDAYLDLKTGEIKSKGQGMNSGTRFLILGTDAPNVGAIKKMVDTAKINGSQLIDARMFMSLIGIKPPKGAAPPNYAGVNLGTTTEVPEAKGGEAKEPAKEGK